jgi:hypothetical protein
MKFVRTLVNINNSNRSFIRIHVLYSSAMMTFEVETRSSKYEDILHARNLQK